MTAGRESAAGSPALLRVGDSFALVGNGEALLFFPETSRLARVSFPAETASDRCSDLLENLYKRLAQEQPSLNAGLVRSWAQRPQDRVSAVNLNLTDRCNLACVYCYARGGNYARLDREFSPEAAVSAVAAAFAQADPERDFRIEFFGGEPFLNEAAIGAVLDWQARTPAWRGHPLGTRNRVSTNLTHLGDALLERVHDSGMILSVSLDGTADVQDEQRPFKDGRGSYAVIIENIRRIRARCPEHTIVARMTVYRHDARLAAIVDELVQTGLFDYVSLYPAAVHTDAVRDVGHSHFSPAFREQFLRLAADYPRLLARGRFKGILELNRYAMILLSGRAALNHCRAGAGYFTASADGSIHPCHRLVGDASWNLGRFDFGVDELERLRPWRVPVLDRPACAACALRYLCGGGCKQEALLATGDLLGHAPRVCAFAHLLFEGALNVAARLTSDVVGKLRPSFRESERLFVLCGQPLAPNRRPPAEAATLDVAGRRIDISWPGIDLP